MRDDQRGGVDERSSQPVRSVYDVIVIGGGSAGAVIAARLTEDPSVRVALVEAGGTPPPHEVMPAAVASLQLDPDVDWMYTGDPGGAGKGLTDGRMMVPRGKMLGGSSGLNYMAYVRGHPGDFDAWAADGGKGWAYADVLPYFAKSEDLAPPDPPDGVVIEDDVHGTGGPSGRLGPLAAHRRGRAVRGGRRGGRDPDGRLQRPRPRRSGRVRVALPDHDPRREAVLDVPRVPRARARAPEPDRDHARPGREGRCSSRPGRARGPPESATATRDGRTTDLRADREVVVSAGAIGSPQLLLLSGIGPSDELASVGVECVVDNPHVGKHLKDHLHVPLVFPAPGVALTMTEIAIALGPDALRAPAGPSARRPGRRRRPPARAGRRSRPRPSGR